MSAVPPDPRPDPQAEPGLPPAADWQQVCRARLHQVLPAQAPIRDFVHHNTLHGFEHLPFAEALAHARRRLRVRPWLDEAESRAAHACGRIDTRDLHAALRQAAPADAPLHDAWPGLGRHAVLLASLRLGPRDAPPEPPEPPPAAVLHACCMALLEAATPPPPNDETPTSVGVSSSNPAAESHPTERAKACGLHGARQWRDLLDELGTTLTWSALLYRLTGVDLRPAIEAQLIPLLSLSLDPEARWSVALTGPGTAPGFYARWRASALADWGWGLADLHQARAALAALPDEPLAAASAELARLGPDPGHWPDYLEALALELPGWSGMVLQCEHPARPLPTSCPEGAGKPAVPLFDYLAVRLVLERLFAEDLVFRTWGQPLLLAELGEFFLERPAELSLRLALYAGQLPETLALDVARLCALTPEHSDPAAWTRVAMAVQRASTANVAKTDPGKASAVLRRRSARLAQLAQQLGLDGDALQRGGHAGLACLEACDSELDIDQRGYLWLLAYEHHYQQQLFAALLTPAPVAAAGATRQPSLAQLVFCMDDREEGSRRHLEEIHPGIVTYGAAGFFGLPIWWQGLDDAQPSALCPVVQTPAHLVSEVRPEAAATAPAELPEARRQRRRRVWQWLTDTGPQATLRPGVLAPPVILAGAPLAIAALGAELLAPAAYGRRWLAWWQGLLCAPRTRLQVSAADAHAPLAAGAPPGPNIPSPDTPRHGFTDAEAASRVHAWLTSIGLTRDFAPLLVIVGHGSTSRNNPHRSAYDCGACSGRHGGPNARALAALANRPAVRQQLAAQGIVLPEQTWLLGAEHHTGDESLHWYDLDLLPASHRAAFDELAAALRAALGNHAVERCRTLASAPPDPTPAQALRHLAGRCQHPGEARPELGHATVAVACIGRRTMTQGLFLDRRAFLISYDPSHDSDARQLEALLLAAGPVGAGISLEYYFSRVDNERLGCGSKVTHNLAGALGVMSGPCADLRTGLPLQMVEVHEPMRLLLVVEQTPALLNAVLQRQAALQQLIGNGWVLLAAKTPDQPCLHRYQPGATPAWQPWTPPDEASEPLAEVSCSRAWFAGQHGRLPPARIVGPAEHKQCPPAPGSPC